jgi:hypothetical protein
MELAMVQIATQRAITGISHQRPQISIRQRPADMEISQELNGSFRISTTASKLFIDQTEAFADANLKSPLRFASESSASSKQSVSQYIAKTARQGEQLKKIEHGANAIPAIAKQNGERPEVQVSLVSIPKDAFRVDFNYVPSEVKVDVNWPDPTIQIRKNDPEIHVPKWETNVYLQQKNSISITSVGAHVNMQM